MPNPHKASIEELKQSLTTPHPTRKKWKNLSGKQFGKLIAIGYLGVIEGRSYWVCICTCPAQTIIRATSFNLQTSKTKSCGCISKSEKGKRAAALEDGVERSWKLKSIPPFMTKEQYYKSLTGYNPKMPGFIYLQTAISRTKSIIKIGVCNDWPERRTTRINSRSDYQHTLVRWWLFKNGNIPKNIEREIKGKFKGQLRHLVKFDGYTETMDNSALENIERLIEIEAKIAGDKAIKSSDYKE